MPTLAESAAEIVAALAGRYGPPAPTTVAEGPFEAILAAFLDRHLESRKVRTLLGGLRDAGLLAPEALTAAAPAEVIEAARQAGVSLPAKVAAPLRRLARAIADLGPVESL